MDVFVKEVEVYKDRRVSEIEKGGKKNLKTETGYLRRRNWL